MESRRQHLGAQALSIIARIAEHVVSQPWIPPDERSRDSSDHATCAVATYQDAGDEGEAADQAYWASPEGRADRASGERITDRAAVARAWERALHVQRSAARAAARRSLDECRVARMQTVARTPSVVRARARGVRSRRAATSAASTSSGGGDSDGEPPSVLEAALSYAARGWRVLPVHGFVAGQCTCARGPACKSAGKHPRLANGLHGATTDIATITGWWEAWPDANVAIATGRESGLVVIDIDDERGIDSVPLDAATMIAVTGRGAHYYYEYPAVHVPSATGIRPHVDVRGDGGYVVAPPSAHSSGVVYAWEDECSPDDAALAQLPRELEALIGSSPRSRAQSQSPGEAHSPGGRRLTAAEIDLLSARWVEGTRHALCLALTGAMRKARWTEDEAATQVREIQDAASDDEDRSGDVRSTYAIESLSEVSAWKGLAVYGIYPDDLPTLRAARRDGSSADTRVETIRAIDVRPETIRWLWDGRVPLAKVTVIEGNPGLGKSSTMIDIAAKLTSGRSMPLSSAPVESADAIIVTYEDGLGDTMRPRLEAAGADLQRVHFVTAVVSDGEPRPMQFPDDVLLIESEIRRVGARLVVIDPLAAALSGTVDSHRDQDIRRVLSRLRDVAESTGAAIVLVRHLRKTAGAAIYSGMGSIGIAGAARSVLLVAKDPDDDSARILAQVKSNLAAMASSIRFRLAASATVLGSRIEWDREVDISADELAAAGATTRGPGARDRAVQFLSAALANGPQPSQDLFRDGKAEGLARRTIERACEQLSMRAFPDDSSGKRRWFWELLTDVKSAKSPMVGGVGGLGGVGGVRVLPLFRKPNGKAPGGKS